MVGDLHHAVSVAVESEPVRDYLYLIELLGVVFVPGVFADREEEIVRGFGDLPYQVTLIGFVVFSECVRVHQFPVMNEEDLARAPVVAFDDYLFVINGGRDDLLIAEHFLNVL